VKYQPVHDPVGAIVLSPFLVKRMGAKRLSGALTLLTFRCIEAAKNRKMESRKENSYMAFKISNILKILFL